MTEKLWVTDTNIFYDNLPEVMSTKKVVLMATTRQELDNHKNNGDSEVRFKARKANRFIFENYDLFIHDVGEYNPESILGEAFSKDVKDNRIVACAYRNGYGIVTNDLNLFSTAKAFGIEVETLAENRNTKHDLDYTGIHKIYISRDSEEESMYARIHQNPSDNVFELLTNQYLIVYDKEVPIEFDEDGKPTKYKVLEKFRFDGESYVRLKLPTKRTYTPRNEEQECAADLLYNNDIPIKIIAGTYGSGKTMAAVKAALYSVLDKGHQDKIMVVRNPIGSGESIGWLKGDMEDKTEGFFKPIVQHLEGGEQEASLLESRGQLTKNIPYYMKGLSIEDSFIIADEAEDFDAKLFKLVGTRLARNSVIAFTGDFNQVEDKYKNNNGMLRAIDTMKGDPLVGIVVLEEDVRSDASKAFSKM